MPEFTHAQKQAVESRNGTILVSAAAGSGKTTVLVERVIQRLADKENPCPADSLLIVTFTKAATAQMKEKIAAALEKRLDENPSDEHLLKQRMLLPFAKISTIDSFCGEIVRENFQALGISPDFKMLEENELAVMRGDAAASVLQKAYSQNDEGFKRLLEMFVSGSNDKALSGLILSIYKNSRAFPFPEKWLDSLVEPYSENKDVMSTVWGTFLKKYLNSVADYCISMLTQSLDLFEKNDSTVYECCSSAFSSFIKIFESFRECVNNESWDKIIHSLDSYDSGLRIGYPRGYRSFFLDMAKALKSEISDIVNKKIKEKIFCCTQDEFIEDNEYVLPAVKKLITLVKEFGREFSALKSASDGADFSDVVENALKLLIKGIDENGNPIKTELAESLCSRYSEILVDEFQDINETQNMLFKAISKNESNLFMVGDVKQSIYNFRQANPEIFLNRRKALDYFEGDNYPAKINLDYNFRSRKGVTDFVNFVFSQLMSEDLGGLKYDDAETLKPKATYPETAQPGAEVHFVCMDDGLSIEKEGEAQYIADYIRKQIEEGLTVTDGDTQRPASYRDFCILLRNANNRADIYADVLNKNSIPCYVASKTGFFDAVEIKTAKEAKNLILMGLKSRHVAATEMNAESSRSHLLFSIYLSTSYINSRGGKIEKMSRLHLIDLAGSERQKKTKAQGERIKEACMINKSLSTLGNVINALVENYEGKNKYIPFRDSKLTYFLKDSLGGNSKTTIVANISTSLIQMNETISTLKFVQRAKMIKNSATLNMSVQENIEALQEEIKKLKSIIAKGGGKYIDENDIY